MNDFDLKALTWDENPQYVERAKIIADRMVKAFLDINKMSGFEFGCGTGLLSMNLQPYMKSITLADNSDGMLEVLKNKIDKHDIKNMNYLKTDLLSEVDFSTKYDLIYSSMTLHHVIDVDAMLQKFNKMLNSAGHICIADLDTEDGSFHGDGFVGHLGFDREKLASQFKNAGFTNIKTESCFVISKTTTAGEERPYQIFLMMADKKRE